MRQVEINQVVATHLESWKKWPDTDDKNYDDVLSQRWQEFYDIGDDTKLIINNRYYPVYYPYLMADYPVLNVEYPKINNTILPDVRVLDKMVKLLFSISEGCQSIYWYHAHQCFQSVARFIPELFNFSNLHFGDDIPISSNEKTFPVCKFFDAIIYTMNVWDFETGDLTAIEYSKRGLNKHYLSVADLTVGLLNRLNDVGFDIEKKAREIEIGNYPKNDFVFVGLGWELNPWRYQLTEKLNKTNFDLRGLKSKLHGVGMRDGMLEPRLPLETMGLPIADLYADSLFSVNLQQSSIYNSRLSDCFICGVVQLIFDPHKELEMINIKPYKHYLPFDGTINGMLAVVDEFKHRKALLADIIRNGYEAYNWIRKEFCITASQAAMYKDNLYKILGSDE